jgi:TonB family protein
VDKDNSIHFFKTPISMKYLTIFCLFMVQNLFGQPIDCAVFTKINDKQTKLKATTRAQMTTTSTFGTMESTTEIDSAKNIHILVKMPKVGKMTTNDVEMIILDGISYSKDAIAKVWYSKKMPPKDSSGFLGMFNTIYKGTDCKIVGTETINGKLLTIVESAFLREKAVGKPAIIQSWYDLKDSVIIKTEINQDLREGKQKVVTEFGAVISPIEKPLNVVPDSLRPKNTPPKRILGTNSDKSEMGTDATPEQIAGYKDGNKALFDFLKNNLVYPKAAREAKIQGTVYAQFFVETNGTITDITIARGIGAGCNEAAIDVIKKMSGSWNCALNGGKPVRSKFTLPIQFRLSNISVKD